MSRLGGNLDGDSGYTLTELSVVILMFTLIVGSITAVVITTLKHQNTLATRGTVLANVRSSLEQVDRDIRAANPLCTATQTEVSMIEINPSTGVTTLVDYSAAGSTLTYKQYATTQTANGNPSCTGSTLVQGITTAVTYYESSTTPTVTRTVLSNLTGTNIFAATPSGTAFDACPTGTDPAAVSGGVAKIAALTVTVSVEPSNLSSPVKTSDCGTYLRNYVPS